MTITGNNSPWTTDKFRPVPEVERRAVERTLNGALDPLLLVVLLRSGPWWISLNGQKPTKLLAAAAMSATRPTLAWIIHEDAPVCRQ